MVLDRVGRDVGRDADVIAQGVLDVVDQLLLTQVDLVLGRHIGSSRVDCAGRLVFLVLGLICNSTWGGYVCD